MKPCWYYFTCPCHCSCICPSVVNSCYFIISNLFCEQLLFFQINIKLILILQCIQSTSLQKSSLLTVLACENSSAVCLLLEKKNDAALKSGRHSRSKWERTKKALNCFRLSFQRGAFAFIFNRIRFRQITLVQGFPFLPNLSVCVCVGNYIF